MSEHDTVPEDDAGSKSEINKRVQRRYDELRLTAKHGIYETIFRIVHEERDAALRESLSVPELDGEWDYRGDDRAWQILFRWGKKYEGRIDEVARLFLRSDGILHPLAAAINESLREHRELLTELLAHAKDAPPKLQKRVADLLAKVEGSGS